MKILLKIISFIGLALTLLPAFLVALGLIDIELHKILMFVGTLAWFATAPFWVGKEKES